MRAKYSIYGELEWKPVSGKTWYRMNELAFRPRPMINVFKGTYVDDMLKYEMALKLIGTWDRKNKTMTVDQFIELV